MPKSKVRKKKPAPARPQIAWSDEPIPEDSFDPELASILAARGWVQEIEPPDELWEFRRSSDLPHDPGGINGQFTAIVLDYPRNQDPYCVVAPSHDERDNPCGRRYASRNQLVADLDEIESWRTPAGNRSETPWELAELRRIGTITDAQLISSLAAYPYLPEGSPAVREERHFGGRTINALCDAEDNGLLAPAEVNAILAGAHAGAGALELHTSHGVPRLPA